MLQTDGPAGQGLATVVEEATQSQTTDRVGSSETNADPLAAYHDEPEPIFEPAEDRELKGPLMVRNMPAHDEIFFRRLSDKLEEVIKDNQAALPAVLKDVDQEDNAAEQTRPEVQPDAKPDVKPEVQTESHQNGSSSTASDSGTEKERSSPRSNESEELDIPLKFKRSINFGAPLGTFRY
jgi:hypothetical protein